MQNSRVEISNKIDISILDESFFISILNEIIESKKQKKVRYELPKN